MGLTKAELNGQLTSPIVRAEQDAENIGPKIARSNDTCGACENGVAQHEVAHTRDNNEAARDLSAAALPDKEHQVVPEPGKDKPFYGTEWAGRTGEFTRRAVDAQTLLFEALQLRGVGCDYAQPIATARACAPLLPLLLLLVGRGRRSRRDGHR